jgi:hypothetical protein
MKKQKWWVCNLCLAEVRGGRSEEEIAGMLMHIKAMHPEDYEVIKVAIEANANAYDEITSRFKIKYEDQ